MVTHNILGDLIKGYLKFGGDLFGFSYTHLTHIIGFNDFGLGMLIITFIYSYAVYSVIMKLIPMYSVIKATIITTGIVMFGGTLFYMANETGTQFQQSEHAIKIAGVIWIIYVTMIVFELAMSVSYFKGLFGRFRDKGED